MKNVKYTLYAKHGSAFRAGLHVLYIGDWIIPDLGKYVVLVHGTMSRNEYNVLCTKSEIPIYEYAPVSWTNIFPYLENGFFRIRRIGSLYKTSDPDVWKGGLKNTMAGINQDWLPGYDRPCLNQWYQCKCRDDWYKIVKEGRDKVNNATVYKVVSFREGKDMFNGLTLAEARSVIQIETNKIQIVK